MLSCVWWTIRLVAALFVFVGALQLMKTGAAGLSILQEDGFLVRNAGSTLGLGWLGALLVLSGSPIAATSLTLVAAGEQAVNGFSELQGFTMLTGSRLGAAFVVLVTAAIFALRAGEGQRKAPVTCAMFALFATAMIYIPAAFIGGALLSWDTFHSLELSAPAQFVDLIDVVYGGMLDRAETYSAPLVFLGGLGVLLLAFKLIDTVLPTLDPDSLHRSRLDLLTRKWPMFFLGCLVALVTMSISVALTVLVPLVAKLRQGRPRPAVHPRREHHDARGHDVRRVRARLARRGPDRARRGDRDERAQRRPARVLLPADPEGHVARAGARGEEPEAAGRVHGDALPDPGDDHRRLQPVRVALGPAPDPHSTRGDRAPFLAGARDPGHHPTVSPSISVVIPAHNAERMLGSVARLAG